jgi:hypothetical protein
MTCFPIFKNLIFLLKFSKNDESLIVVDNKQNKRALKQKKATRQY